MKYNRVIKYCDLILDIELVYYCISICKIERLQEHYSYFSVLSTRNWFQHSSLSINTSALKQWLSRVDLIICIDYLHQGSLIYSFTSRRICFLVVYVQSRSVKMVKSVDSYQTAKQSDRDLRCLLMLRNICLNLPRHCVYQTSDAETEIISLLV